MSFQCHKKFQCDFQCYNFIVYLEIYWVEYLCDLLSHLVGLSTRAFIYYREAIISVKAYVSCGDFFFQFLKHEKPNHFAYLSTIKGPPLPHQKSYLCPSWPMAYGFGHTTESYVHAWWCHIQFSWFLCTVWPTLVFSLAVSLKLKGKNPLHQKWGKFCFPFLLYYQTSQVPVVYLSR